VTIVQVIRSVGIFVSLFKKNGDYNRFHIIGLVEQLNVENHIGSTSGIAVILITPMGILTDAYHLVLCFLGHSQVI
jgi:hypothetical protein